MSETEQALRTIFKYRVIVGDQAVRVPRWTAIRHFAFKDDGLYVWIEHDRGPVECSIPLVVVGTGWDVPTEATHEGTALTPDGFAWHLYDLTPLDERF